MLIIKIILWILGVVTTMVIFWGIIYIIIKLIEYEIHYIDDVFERMTNKIKIYFRRGGLK